jgi:RimJ/RimL family protein N-acetyltransferase
MTKAVSMQALRADMEPAFLAMTNASQVFHKPWVNPPLTHKEFAAFYKRYQEPNQKSFVLFEESEQIVGVFNLSEIVRGCFQNAYLGFYVAKDFAGLGFMRQGMQLLLQEAFMTLDLHRVEANIQPHNVASIHLVKKSGFRLEGFSPRYLKIYEKWCDHERFAITIEDYKGNKDAGTK